MTRDVNTAYNQFLARGVVYLTKESVPPLHPSEVRAAKANVKALFLQGWSPWQCDAQHLPLTGFHLLELRGILIASGDILVAPRL